MINYRLVLSYLAHWLEVVDEHSLQAPFIYSVYSDVIKGSTVGEWHHTIESRRCELMNDHSTINIVDYGAGSKASGDRERQIKSVARSALSSTKFSQLLSRLAQSSEPSTILELGTSFGITTGYLAKAAPSANILTFEGCPETMSIAERTIENLDLKNVKLISGNIDTQLPKALSSQETIDFAYIDANHTYHATLSYVQQISKKVNEKSIIVIDDIHWSQGMHQAWNELIKQPIFSLSIDLFEAGLLFFKPLRQKEHYFLNF